MGTGQGCWLAGKDNVRGIPSWASQPTHWPPSALHSSLFSPHSDQGLVCFVFVCLMPLGCVLCIMRGRGQVVQVCFSCLLKETFGTEGSVPNGDVPGAILYFLGLEVFTPRMLCAPVSSAWTIFSALRPASTGFMSCSDVLSQDSSSLVFSLPFTFPLLVRRALIFNLPIFTCISLCLPHWTVNLRHRACVVFI